MDIDVRALLWYHMLYVENDTAIRLKITNTWNQNINFLIQYTRIYEKYVRSRTPLVLIRNDLVVYTIDGANVFKRE